MGEIIELERNCSDCGADLNIEIDHENETIEGGHYWALPFDEHGELWECEDCYEEAGELP